MFAKMSLVNVFFGEDRMDNLSDTREQLHGERFATGEGTQLWVAAEGGSRESYNTVVVDIFLTK